MKKIILVTCLVVLTSLIFVSCTFETTYKCAQCGKSFTTQPYQCIMGICNQPNAGQVAGGLETFCSCECGIKYMAKQGFSYKCRGKN